MDDLERGLQELLDAQGPRRSAILQELLDEVARLEAYAEADLPAELAVLVDARREQLSAQVLTLLLGWRRLGGSLSLGAPEGVEQPTEPAEPAEPVQRAAPPVEAAPPPPVVVRPSGPAASAADLAALQAHVAGGETLDTGHRPDEGWEDTLAELLDMGSHGGSFEEELESVGRAVAARKSWLALPQPIQVRILEWLAARLRSLQNTISDKDWRIEQAFSVLTRYSREERPGFCYGLARGHQPRSNSWADDAEGLWRELRAALPQDEEHSANVERALNEILRLQEEMAAAPEIAQGAVRSQLVRSIESALGEGVSVRDPRLIKLSAPLLEHLDGVRFRALRRVLRDELADAQKADEEDSGVADIPEDWPWWGHCKGARAVMVGGSPRELRRVRLEQAFDFASLEWVPAQKRRNSLQNLRARIRRGNLDLVIVLRSFIGHDTDDVVVTACKEEGVPWVHIERGYGIVGLRQAVERFLPELTVAAGK